MSAAQQKWMQYQELKQISWVRKHLNQSKVLVMYRYWRHTHPIKVTFNKPLQMKVKRYYIIDIGKYNSAKY